MEIKKAKQSGAVGLAQRLAARSLKTGPAEEMRRRRGIWRSNMGLNTSIQACRRFAAGSDPLLL